VLFVDDEPNVLSGLRRMLRPLQALWQMSFANSSDEALRLLQQDEFDVIVTDMRMPGMDGAELLLQVRARFPSVARIILSGQTEQKDALRSASAAHRFLAKPCEPEMLKTAIDGVCALRDLLQNNTLLAAVTGLEKLPSLPDNYIALSREVRSASATAHTVSRIIAKDLAMSAKVLQLVNSAFFGLTREVLDVDRAVALLGIETINSLLLSHAAFDTFEKAREVVDLGSLWKESLLVGRAARLLAACEEVSQPIQHAAYEAGLMHDIGRLVLATTVPTAVREIGRLVRAEHLPVHEAETRVVGCDHGLIGAYLLDLWGLPGWIVEAVAYHHRPALSVTDGFGPLAAVHAANALLAEVQPGIVDDGPELDLAWLTALGLDERLPTWREKISKLSVEADA
jgi:HD-like signal output (HDOD) protein